MASIDKAIAFLESSGSGNISEAARKYNVNRSTLSKRSRGKTRSTAQGYHKQQLLTHKQELVLVEQINRLSEWCLPPTPSMVRAWAAALCGTEPGKNWAAAFGSRHKAELDCKYLSTINLERHKADSEHPYRQHFAVLNEKIIQYDIQPHNCYNMDEKGFLISHLQKVKRIFPKALMRTQKLLGFGQDGARNWITLIATICADGSSLPPALIYKAVSGNLQDTWLQDYKPDEHPCWFASSPNGWTSDDRAQLKAYRELETQQKREDRATKAAARKTQKALENVQRERDKLARKALKQLQIESSSSITRRRGRPPKQKQSKESVAIVTEPEVRTAPEQPKSRTGRAVKRPRFFDEI